MSHRPGVYATEINIYHSHNVETRIRKHVAPVVQASCCQIHLQVLLHARMIFDRSIKGLRPNSNVGRICLVLGHQNGLSPYAYWD